MAIKILHTSDWHLGKQLMKIDFSQDMNLFFDWLIQRIQSENIDVLLMSGDLFDHANPSQLALRNYYLFLKRMISLDCKVIITGGNHDSPYVLNAPRELLDALDISVVGGMPAELNEVFVEVEVRGEKVVIAAVPFLRDKDVRQSTAGETYADKVEQTRAGLEAYFQAVDAYYSQHFDGIPLVIMAHLFVQGAMPSESEREIQIGNLASIDSHIFGQHASYVALGHIHKPQRAGSDHVRYCGSPIPMSFSEKNDQKQVVMVTLSGELCAVEPIPIPSFRKLKTFKGTFASVVSQLETYETDSVLEDLAEIEIVEDQENATTIRAVEDLMASEEKYKVQLLKAKIDFKNKIAGTSSILKKGEDIADFTPEQLFEKRLSLDESIENKSELMLAFKEILEQMHNSTSNETRS